MKDGSDAVSDWPLLNALLNTAGGATWVSLHHGGGVGMGYSQHAGVVIVCDGTDAAARRIERVLWNDPGTGVMRHADAGYDERRGLRPRAGPEPADARRPSRSCVDALVPGALTLDDLQAHPRAAVSRSRLDPAALAGDRRQRRGGAGAPPPATRRSTASTPASASWPATRISEARSGHAAAQPDPLAQRRRRRAAGARRGAADAGAEGGQPGARALRRARRWSIDTLLAVHNAGLVPFVPSQGSVGASGDLAPLAHMTLALMGEGEMRGRRRSAVPARRGAARGRHRAAGAAGQGRPGADQRHAGLHRAGAACAVRASSRCSRRRW